MEHLQLGGQISRLRKKIGLTQAELAYKCRLNIRTIQRIESGDVIPRAYTLKIISEALGNDLLDDNDSQSNHEQMKYYRQIFKRRKKFRLASFLSVMIFMIAIFLLAFPSWTLFGMPKHSWAPFFYLVIFAHLIGIGLTWRCPGCNSLLGDVFSARYCGRCGLSFYDDKEEE